MHASDARSLLSTWRDQQKPLLCLSMFSGYRLVISGSIFSVSEESFTLRSTRSDSSLTLTFGSSEVEFEEVDPDQLWVMELGSLEPQVAAITTIFPMKRLIRVPLEGLPSREHVSSLHRGIRIKN